MYHRRVRKWFKATTSHQDQKDALLRGLDMFVYISYRCELYELRFQPVNSSPGSQNLESAPLESYTLIFGFLAKAAHAYKECCFYRAFAAFWSSDDIWQLEI
ncbi:hypothetical protein N7462_008550 [Penicillium macrosclerotiorum]|uniref:uncharacterized protein n=1 Tax=Penicillium macrosclerotiorum TaxID=303699 RepID=UPI00254968FD|nr:uncharacterized protein N7462_008550 [Penicillium macrosclerotiorum]KAJ5675653.1 hypothetical protein N7462_008550 [Penicillium macrosclerotiorum]